MDKVIYIEHATKDLLFQELKEPYYFILLIGEDASFSLDFNEYRCRGKSLLFLSPYQLLKWNGNATSIESTLRFHGDFYCIEYHKMEVACNGILFNNIYESPLVSVPPVVYQEIKSTFEKILSLDISDNSCDLPLAKTYLQLILALSSREKQIQISERTLSLQKEQVADFRAVLENHFIGSRSVSFYASHYGLSVDVFSKKIKRRFNKSPSVLIQERLILEAKKLLHLTYKNIKEIATELRFEDEFYFSRYFKKQVGLSPKAFREQVGISIVAK